MRVVMPSDLALLLLSGFGFLCLGPSNFVSGLPQDTDIPSDFRIDHEFEEFDDFNVQTSYIERGFTNKKSFTCPRIKALLKTGTSAADLSPEDIDVVATMGDAIVTGMGLWPGTDVEFRGAVFTTGGDANIDGLPTFSNILAQFNGGLRGVSHGMGTREQLPDHQLNVALEGAESDTMTLQAHELVRRLRNMNNTLTGEPLWHQWVMVFVATGTEELCGKCDEPNVVALRHSLTTLRRGIPKAFIVLLGPVHVSKSSQQTYNLLKPRCPCLSHISDAKLAELQRRWRNAFLLLEREFNQREYPTFEVLALPLLQITSRHPEQLFIAERPLLNRRGHAYAAKWLWNRLITGPRYNASKVALSEDSYYCPALGCPYFRTSRNLQHCVTLTLTEYKRMFATTESVRGVTHNPRIENMQENILVYIVVVVLCATVSVFALGTAFYMHGLKQTKSRFENIQGV